MEKMTNTATTSKPTIPTISIASLLKSKATEEEKEDYKKTLSSIRYACETYGFFYISNHGIPTTLIQDFRSSCANLFEHTPKQELLKIKRTQTNSRGYFDDELTKNKLDWKECFDFGAQNGSLDKEGRDGYNQWPSSEESSSYTSSSTTTDNSFEKTQRLYFETMQELSRILLGSMAQSLNLPHDILDEYFVDNHTSYLRLNYYRKCPNPEDVMAVHHHTDAGALTILYQDVTEDPSLQVLHENEWIYIPPIKDTFVINIGDMMQVWSNDIFKAPLHRVMASSKFDRYSAPFFYNPAYSADVQPLKGLYNNNDGEGKEGDVCKKYKVVNWGDFRAQRFAGDYANLGEEIQIHHYKIEQ